MRKPVGGFVYGNILVAEITAVVQHAQTAVQQTGDGFGRDAVRQSGHDDFALFGDMVEVERFAGKVQNSAECRIHRGERFPLVSAGSQAGDLESVVADEDPGQFRTDISGCADDAESRFRRHVPPLSPDPCARTPISRSV